MRVSESTLEKHIARALLMLMDRLGRSGKRGARASSLQDKHELDARDGIKRD